MEVAVVPVVLFVIFLIGIGATAGNYVGQTPYEAIETVKNTHDYSCSEEYFNDMYDAFRQIGYANKPITVDDVRKALGMGENIYNGATEYAGAFIEHWLGSFDSGWTADYSSREIKVYDDETGDLIGSFKIYGVVSGSLSVTTIPPVLVEPSRNSYICFATTYGGETYYSTSVFTRYGGETTVDTSSFSLTAPFDMQATDRFASNMAFEMSPNVPDSYVLKLVYDGRTSYAKDGLLVGNPVIQGNSDIDVTIPYIGTAVTPDGDVGVRPDGSIVLPNGTVVRPDVNTGAYPFPVVMTPDWWAKLAAAIAGAGAGEDSPTDAGTTNLELSGIRALLQSINDKIGGLGDTIKNAIAEFFGAKPSDYNVTTDNWFNTFVDAVKRFLRGFGLNVQ